MAAFTETGIVSGACDQSQKTKRGSLVTQFLYHRNLVLVSGSVAPKAYVLATPTAEGLESIWASGDGVRGREGDKKDQRRKSCEQLLRPHR